MRAWARLGCALAVAACVARSAGATQVPREAILTPIAHLPLVAAEQAPACPTASTASFWAIPFEGGPYKDNRLTDENADFRLSILGYAPVGQPQSFVTYTGAPDPNAPRLHTLFEPHRVPAFVRVQQVYDWHWNESWPPPYGVRGALNTSLPWPVTVVDLGTSPGELIRIPDRATPIFEGGEKALVLYADEDEITVAYLRADQVAVNGAGYVIHLLGLCVDPNLVAVYRAQLDASGRRATGRLPGLRDDQPIGRMISPTLSVAIRDGGMPMDPRSERDWWAGHP
jgi:hypothetical protein